eukprot:gene12122-15228_t
MSPRDSSPIVSIVQDICTGVYRLTKNNVYLNEKQMFNILSPIIDGIKPIPKAQLLPGTNMERWSGKQLLSTIIPPNINVRTANKFFDERKADDSENYVIIENGEIIQGTLDKSIYQGRSKGLVHSIYNEYSPDDTRMFFDNTQQLICNWLVYSGFSTGISDLVVSSETAEKCNEIVKNMKVKVLDFIAKIHKGELDNKSTKNNADYFEQEVNNLLNRAAKQIGDMAASQVDDNDNPKQFELSGENGVMLGLYLSCGSIEGTSIVISNDDHFVKSFVREWFDRQCIYNKDTYKSVIGISDLHAQFFKKWAGRFSTKHVPDDAYIAPKEFVCGVLSGFMSSMDNVNISCDSRIISSTQSMYSKHGSSAFLDLCPMYILENVEKLCSKLVVTKIAGPSRFLQMLLRAHLSPKKLIMKHRMCKDAFDLIVQQITQRFYSSMAHPGDMVGVVAAQSVGEPTTQLSAHGSTRILVQKRNGEFYNGSISKLIDNLIHDNPSKVIDIGHGSVVMDLDGSYSIVGVSNEEKTSWKAISQISRHPANGGMVRIHTKSGKTTCATLSHSFLKRVESGIEPVLGSDLKLGDRVPVARFIPTVEDALQSITVDGWEIDLSMEYGWLCGAQLAGLKSMSSTTYIKMSENSLPGWVFAANLDFISGLLCGWLNNTNGNISVSSCDDAIILLAYLGVFTSKTDDGCLKIATKYAVILNKIGIKKSTMNKLITDEDNDMIPEIGCMLDSQLLNRESLREYIDTFQHTKNNKYMQMLRQAVDSDVVWDEIIHIEYLDDPKEFVYDFTVPGNDSFMVDTAVLVHNTLNSVEYSTPLLLKVDGGATKGSDWKVY